MIRQRNGRSWIGVLTVAGAFALGVTALGCQLDGTLEAETSLESVGTVTEGCGWGGHIQRVINRGAEIHTTNGIMVGPDDHLYVTSVVGRSITELDPHSGAILRELGPADGVESPDDLVFGPDGSLYWTAFLMGEVAKMAPDGTKTTVAVLEPGVNAITISDDGTHLYVSRVFLGDELWDIDLVGGAEPRLIASGLGGFNGMDVGPDGYLYGPLWFPGKIARVDVQTGAVEIVAEGFNTPCAVKFDYQGRLHALDQETGEVFRVDPATGAKELLATSHEGLDNLAFDSHDRLFLTNAHDGSVVRVLPSGRIRHLQRGGLTSPGGIALAVHNGEPRLYVSDTYSLRELHPWTGREVGFVHSVIGRPGLATPMSVAAYGEKLVTTSWFGQTVQVWDPDTATVEASHMDFSVPLYAAGFGDDLVVSELSSHCVWRRPAGTVDKEAVACGLPVPAGLASQNGDLYATEWALGSVFQLIDDGVVLSTPRTVVSGLSHPEGIAVAPSGKLIVVATGTQELLAVDAQTGETEVVADNLSVALPAAPGYPPTWVFNGVAVDSCGVMYVTEDDASSVTQIVPRDPAVFHCLVQQG